MLGHAGSKAAVACGARPTRACLVNKIINARRRPQGFFGEATKPLGWALHSSKQTMGRTHVLSLVVGFVSVCLWCW